MLVSNVTLWEVFAYNYEYFISKIIFIMEKCQ